MLRSIFMHQRKRLRMSNLINICSQWPSGSYAGVCFGTDLESAGPPRASNLNNTDLTADSKECEFECSPSNEWRETQLLTIQITAAAE